MGAQQGHNMSLSVIKNVIRKLTTNQVTSFISEGFPLFDIALRQTMQERDNIVSLSSLEGHNVSLSNTKFLKCLITTGMFISTHVGAYVFIERALGQWMLNRDTMCPSP